MITYFEAGLLVVSVGSLAFAALAILAGAMSVRKVTSALNALNDLNYQVGILAEIQRRGVGPRLAPETSMWAEGGES